MCHANTFFSNSCKKRKENNRGHSIFAFTVDGRIQINSKFLTLHDRKKLLKKNDLKTQPILVIKFFLGNFSN